jgi:hypothetical protein
MKTFNEFVNENYVGDNGTKIAWDSKNKVILVGRKKVDPWDIEIENFDKKEMWLEVNLKDVKALNVKEKEDLQDWITGAYDDSVQSIWYDIFGDRLF